MLESIREQGGEMPESVPDQDELMQIPEVREHLEKPKSDMDAIPNAGKKAERVAEIKHKTEEFGRSNLDPEHTGLALKLGDKIGRMRKLSIQRVRAEIWAAAIIHVIARLNFLFDPENDVLLL